MKVGFFCSLSNLLHADTAGVIAILYILSNAAVKQDWLLGHYANLSSKEGYVDSLRWMAINQLKMKAPIIRTVLYN